MHLGMGYIAPVGMWRGDLGYEQGGHRLSIRRLDQAFLEALEASLVSIRKEIEYSACV